MCAVPDDALNIECFADMASKLSLSVVFGGVYPCALENEIFRVGVSLTRPALAIISCINLLVPKIDDPEESPEPASSSCSLPTPPPVPMVAPARATPPEPADAPGHVGHASEKFPLISPGDSKVCTGDIVDAPICSMTKPALTQYAVVCNLCGAALSRDPDLCNAA